MIGDVVMIVELRDQRLLRGPRKFQRLLHFLGR
jgi:hypothetical protein